MLFIITSLVFLSMTVAWAYGISTFFICRENRRFWRSHQERPVPSLGFFPRTALIIPCKGMELRLRENLTCFLHQDHPNFEICFVVETREDPAYRVIKNLMRENRHVNSRVIVAGQADQSGQKVHNLLAATSKLSSEVEILAFADSDAAPNAGWLKWLVHTIGEQHVGARTGYRWMVPGNKSLATILGCTLNNVVASMMGRGSRYPVWGGSWAIHRRVFNEIGLREAWKGVLSDDLVASRAIRLSRLKINFEPKCICSSHVKFTFPQLFMFIRRQLLIVRKYNPLAWTWLFATVAACQIGLWGGLILGIHWLSQGNVNGAWLVLSAISLYTMAIARAVMRQNMGRLITHEWRAYRRARKFDIALAPVTGLFTLVFFAASAIGNQFTWRGIRYDVGQAGRIQLIGRLVKNPVWSPQSAEKNPVQMNGTTAQTLKPNQNRRAA